QASGIKQRVVHFALDTTQQRGFADVMRPATALAFLVVLAALVIALVDHLQVTDHAPAAGTAHQQARQEKRPALGSRRSVRLVLSEPQLHLFEEVATD